MLRYALYARKSSEEKRITEKPLREQVAECRRIAESQGLFVTHEFQESKSAKIPRMRPFFAKMLGLLEKGEIDGILCWHVNRLARNMEEGGKIAQMLIDGELKEIRTPTEIHRTGDNIMSLVIQAASSTQFSLDLSIDVRRGMNGHVAVGGWNSKAAQGYLNLRNPANHKQGIVLPDPERFDLIRKGWEMMLTGSYNPHQVIKELNEVWGYRTKKTVKRGGTPLSRSSGYQLFANPFYAGYVVYKGELHKGNHTPMVKEEEFELVQIHLRRSLKQSVHKREFAYTGLMRCGYCGLAITAEYHRMRNGQPYIHYRCTDAKQNCNKKGVSEAGVEAEIVRNLDRITIDPELCVLAEKNILRSLETAGGDSHAIYDQQQRALTEIEQQLTNLDMMVIKGMLTDKERYREHQDRLRQEKNGLIKNIEASRRDMEALASKTRFAFHYIRFARERFAVETDIRKKREIAGALASEYWFYGRERTISIQLKPLLLEIVRFSDKIKSTKTGTFEPKKTSSGSQQSIQSTQLVLSGGTKDTFVDPPQSLIEQLRLDPFPRIVLDGAALCSDSLVQ